MEASLNPNTQRQLAVVRQLNQLETSLSAWESYAAAQAQAAETARHNINNATTGMLISFLFIPALGLGLLGMVWGILASMHYSDKKRTAEKAQTAARATIENIRGEVIRVRNALTLAQNPAVDDQALVAMIGPVTNFSQSGQVASKSGERDLVSLILVGVLVTLVIGTLIIWGAIFFLMPILPRILH